MKRLLILLALPALLLAENWWASSKTIGYTGKLKGMYALTPLPIDVSCENQAGAGLMGDFLRVCLTVDSAYKCAAHVRVNLYVRTGYAYAKGTSSQAPRWPSPWKLIGDELGVGSHVIDLPDTSFLGTDYVQFAESIVGFAESIVGTDSCKTDLLVKPIALGGGGSGSVSVTVTDSMLSAFAFLHDSMVHDSTHALWARAAHLESLFVSYVVGHSPIRFMNQVRDSINDTLADYSWVRAHSGLWLDSVKASGADSTIYTWQGVYGKHAGAVTWREDTSGVWWVHGGDSTIVMPTRVQLGSQNHAARDSWTVTIGGWQNCAKGLYSGILGGVWDTASGRYSAVIGGHAGWARGHYSAVLSGDVDTSFGDYSIAAGYGIHAGADTFRYGIRGTENGVIYGDCLKSLHDVIVGGDVQALSGGLFSETLWVKTRADLDSVRVIRYQIGAGPQFADSVFVGQHSVLRSTNYNHNVVGGWFLGSDSLVVPKIICASIYGSGAGVTNVSASQLQGQDTTGLKSIYPTVARLTACSTARRADSVSFAQSIAHIGTYTKVYRKNLRNCKTSDTLECDSVDVDDPAAYDTTLNKWAYHCPYSGVLDIGWNFSMDSTKGCQTWALVENNGTVLDSVSSFGVVGGASAANAGHYITKVTAADNIRIRVRLVTANTTKMLCTKQTYWETFTYIK